MKTSICVAVLYLTSISVLMCGDNYVSKGCRVLLLKLFEDIKINWIVYVANFFTVIYIVSLAIKEHDRNPQAENLQDSAESSSQPDEGHGRPPEEHVVNLQKANDTYCDESCSSSDEADSGISATVSKEDSNTEVENQPHASKDKSEWELGHQELVSRIKEILLEARKEKTYSEDDKDLSEGDLLLQVTPVSSNEVVFHTPQQNTVVSETGIVNLSESSDDEILACQLDTIDEESSWKSESMRSQNESQNVELQLKDGDKCTVNQLLTSATKTHFHSEDPVAARDENEPFRFSDKGDLHLNLQSDEIENDELSTPPIFGFSKPLNLLEGKEEKWHFKQAEKVTELYKNQNFEDEEQSDATEEYREEKKKDDYKYEVEPMDTQDDSLDYNFSTTDSFSEVISKLPPGLFYSGKQPSEDMSPSINLTNDSILNTTFSVSSLEDMLSPELRHRVPTTSPHRISLDPQSLDECNSRFLGIRLHKPAGVKDVLLSIVSVDEERGLDTVSDTWTLGNREDMELILSIDDTIRQSHKHYVGRYSLVFNDITDNSLEDASETASRENSFLHSFLKDDKSDSYVADSVSEDDIDQLSISRFGRLVWKAANAQEAQVSLLNTDVNVSEVDGFNEVSYIGEACSDVFENVHSTSREFVSRLHDISRDWLNDYHNLRNVAMAAGCVGLTCFVLYRTL